MIDATSQLPQLTYSTEQEDNRPACIRIILLWAAFVSFVEIIYLAMMIMNSLTIPQLVGHSQPNFRHETGEIFYQFAGLLSFAGLLGGTVVGLLRKERTSDLLTIASLMLIVSFTLYRCWNATATILYRSKLPYLDWRMPAFGVVGLAMQTASQLVADIGLAMVLLLLIRRNQGGWRISGRAINIWITVFLIVEMTWPFMQFVASYNDWLQYFGNAFRPKMSHFLLVEAALSVAHGPLRAAICLLIVTAGTAGLFRRSNQRYAVLGAALFVIMTLVYQINAAACAIALLRGVYSGGTIDPPWRFTQIAAGFVGDCALPMAAMVILFRLRSTVSSGASSVAKDVRVHVE